MATETSGNSHGFLYFIVGALIVGVVVLGFLFYNGNLGQSREENAIERSADAIGDAADEIGDAAKRATPDGG
jgi:hypothetical protein